MTCNIYVDGEANPRGKFPVGFTRADLEGTYGTPLPVFIRNADGSKGRNAIALDFGHQQDFIVVPPAAANQGWIRDLTRECVEPNPGPKWTEIYKKAAEYSEKDDAFWKDVNDYFEKIRNPTHDDVRFYLDTVLKIQPHSTEKFVIVTNLERALAEINKPSAPAAANQGSMGKRKKESVATVSRYLLELSETEDYKKYIQDPTKHFKSFPYTGTQNFYSLRTNMLYYFDNTRFIKEVIKRQRCILYRPPRFGKSLFLDTLQYFVDLNKRDHYDLLFKGTAIYSQNIHHNRNYVIKFSFSQVPISSINMTDFTKSFWHHVASVIDDFFRMYTDISIDIGTSRDHEYLSSFCRLLKSQDIPLFIFVDEYDFLFNNDILSFDQKTAKIVSSAIELFFTIIKDSQSSVYVTGITRLAASNISSAMGWLYQLNDGFYDILGIPHSAVNKIVTDELAQKTLRENYNGFRFHPTAEPLYCTTQILLAMEIFSKDSKMESKLIGIEPNQSQSPILQSIIGHETGLQLVTKMMTDGFIHDLNFDSGVFSDIKYEYLYDFEPQNESNRLRCMALLLYDIGFATNVENKFTFRISNNSVKNRISKIIAERSIGKFTQAIYDFKMGKIEPLLRVLEQNHPWFNLGSGYAIKNTQESTIHSLLGTLMWIYAESNIEYYVHDGNGKGQWIDLMVTTDQEVQVLEIKYYDGNFLALEGRKHYANDFDKNLETANRIRGLTEEQILNLKSHSKFGSITEILEDGLMQAKTQSEKLRMNIGLSKTIKYHVIVCISATRLISRTGEQPI